MEGVKKDRELLKAKRLSKVFLLLAGVGLIGLGLAHHSMISIPQTAPKVIEITFEQVALAKEEPPLEPETEPEKTEDPIEEPVEEKILSSELSEEKIDLPEEKPLPEVKQPEPAPELPKKSEVKPKEKPVKKPKPKLKPEEKKVSPQKVSEAAKETGAPAAAPSPAPAGDPGTSAKPKLTSLLLGVVEKYKRYPKAARRAGLEGVAVVEFAINAQGTVTSAQVVKLTDKTSLDKAAQDLAQKIVGTAFHLPNPGLTVRVPIRYQLTD